MVKTVLFPEVCPFCGKASARGICKRCMEKLEKLRPKEPLCMKCGKPVRFMWQEYCYDCAHTYHYYDRGRALWLHLPPVSRSIYRFKFHNQRVFAKYYAKEAGVSLENVIQAWNPSLIIPVPLHKAKKRRRGYNQAELFAEELSRVFSIPADGSVLVRTRNTSPQKRLGMRERKKNLEGAFRVAGDEEQKKVQKKKLLLVDDIYTTGSTLDAAAKALKSAGAEKVYYLTISIGQGY